MDHRLQEAAPDELLHPAGDPAVPDPKPALSNDAVYRFYALAKIEEVRQAARPSHDIDTDVEKASIK